MITIDLNPQTAALSLGVGLVFSLLCYLTTNLSPGGMITPGWLAIAMVQDYLQIVVIFVMTIVTFLCSDQAKFLTGVQTPGPLPIEGPAAERGQ